MINFLLPASGDALVSVVEAQQKELDRLYKLESAVKKIFNEDQVKKIATGKRVVYDMKTIQDGVATYAQVGASSYDYMRTNLKMPLPALTTIRSYLRGISVSPGILKDFFTMMKPKIKAMKDPRHKKFGLLVDQVALEPKLELDTTTGKIIGYPTLSPNRKNR